jgi:hypothetical protein
MNIGSDAKKTLKYISYSLTLHIVLGCAIYFFNTSSTITIDEANEETVHLLTIKSTKKEIIIKEKVAPKKIKKITERRKKIKPNIYKSKTIKKSPPLRKKLIQKSTEVIKKHQEGLSYREENNIRSQITRCYKKALSDNNIDRYSSEILVEISIDKNSIINPNYNLISSKIAHNNQKLIKRIEKSIKEALVFCSPVRNLPQHKYKIWKSRIIKFENNI